MSHTIVAHATAAGISGLSVVRISGSSAFAIADSCFRGRGPLSAVASHTIHYGTFISGDQAIDRVTASVFRAPNSYTGEDTVEFGVHGGAVVPQEVVRALILAGGVLAGPGEFTRRAFINGKLDLVQAEAVADLIHAISVPGAEIAARQAAGGVTGRFSGLRNSLLEVAGRIELEMDFADEFSDLPGGLSEAGTLLTEPISAALSLCGGLLDSYQAADILRNGFVCAIIGRPNAGKSTLFNALLGQERAIVSRVPGTTRDFISELLYINDIPIKLVDTAGIRTETADTIEAAGISYSMRLLAEAHLILLVNSYNPAEADCLDLYNLINEKFAGKPILLVQNKLDLFAADFEKLGTRVLDFEDNINSTLPTFYISAKGGDSRRLAELKAGIGKIALRRAWTDTDMLLNQRQAAKLVAIKQTLETIVELLAQNAGGEILTIELRNAGNMLDELTGRTWNEAVLNNIFDKFCIGK